VRVASKRPDVNHSICTVGEDAAAWGNSTGALRTTRAARVDRAVIAGRDALALVTDLQLTVAVITASWADCRLA
jgi:hypothetical protein